MELTSCVTQKSADYRNEYEKWIEYFNTNFTDGIDIPTDEVLLLIALDVASKQQAAFNRQQDIE